MNVLLEKKETGATGPPPSPNLTVSWLYQWTGCTGPPGQAREGGGVGSSNLEQVSPRQHVVAVAVAKTMDKR
ncbi:hypothetical protein SERLA73DRAFT_192285 [Serpula lacrymans var. lacrymans S7.3]|uniref:Uncharacterized protein n=1 Tax=Serpula lacrymans var. lacrymans (strain S7.3) TaxID=936435 RepID=F8QJL9_SERL3|nr:hypothetical protein SERLA73DRAFT_192285 [Serpula lacrymans var. lacrymans S7.3]